MIQRFDRRAIAAALIWLLWPSIATAQQTVLSIEGGATISNVTGLQDQFGATAVATAGAGVLVGVGILHGIAGPISFGAEIVYAERRFEENVQDFETGERLAIHTRLRYVEVPFLVRWDQAGRDVGGFLSGGVAVARLLSAPQTLMFARGDLPDRMFDAATDPYDLFARWNGSAIVGGGVRLRAFEIEARADIGFADLRGSAFAQSHLPPSRMRSGVLIGRWRF